MNCLDSTYLIDLLDPDRDRHDAARRWMAVHDDEPTFAPTFAVWDVLRGAGQLDGVEGVNALQSDLEWLYPLPFSLAAAFETAVIEAECRNAGATLVTADPDFDRVRGLDVVHYAD